MVEDDSKDWRPTDRVIRGVVVKPYLPLRKFPELKDQHTHFFNLYAGDELFIFEETKDGKWLRCYLRWTPLPESYVSGTLLISDQLVHLNNRLVIAPRKFVQLDLERVVVDMPFLRMPCLSDFRFAVSEVCETPTLFESLAAEHDPQTTGLWASSKLPKPSFPYFRYQDRPLADEVAASIVSLSSLIYGVYSSGDLNIFEQLVTSFYELDALRMKLQFRLYTSHEMAKISRHASALMANVSKLLSSKEKSGPDVTTPNNMVSDPSGMEGIFARDVNTGELLTYEEVSSQSLVLNTMLHGLSKNFPVSNYNFLRTDSTANEIFEATESHILVDVNDVRSDASVGNPMLQNLSASMYLCSRRGVLTEPFTVNMDSDQITSLNNISAALFKNIPASQIERGNIYLAVTLSEKIPFVVNQRSNGYQSKSNSPFVPFNPKDDERISYIRRGVAAGAVDITRVFGKYNESNVDLSEAFKIKINLFGSFLSSNYSTQGKAGNDLSQHESAGWGDLIDRILQNSHNGVAVNPRATSLMVTIKEIKALTVNKSAEAAIGAIKSIPTYFYDILSENSERIYLSLGKVSLSNNLQTNVQSITIKVAFLNEQIQVNKIADEDIQKSWEFITVRPGESVGETIRIDGLRHMRENETMTILAFVNGLLMAKLSVYIKKENKLVEYKKFTTFQLPNAIREPLLDLELTTRYVGKKYNLESTLEKFQELPSTNFGEHMDTNGYCVDLLRRMTRVSVDLLQIYFQDIFLTYLLCFERVELKTPAMFKDEVRRQLFFSFVDFIDKLIAGSDRQRCSFRAYYDQYSGGSKELPRVGSVILQHMTAVIRDSSREWGVLGSTLTRTSLYLIMISLMSSKNSKDDWKQNFQSFFSEICQFVACSSETVAKDQISVLQTYDAWLGIVSTVYEPDILVQFSLGLLQSCRSKEKTLGFSVRELSPMEAKYLNTKLSLLRRIILHRDLHNYLYGTVECQMVRCAFLSKCIDWALVPYTFTNLNISATRLANGVLISLLENVEDRKLARNLLRLLPTLCKAFLLTRRYCKENNHFKPKITFTALFPFNMPPPMLPMDSLVQTDVVVEVLLELITIVCDLTKLSERMYGPDVSMTEIFSECTGDIEFQTDFCSKQISNSHITTLYHIIKIIARGEFFPAQKWLGVCAMFDRSMSTLLIMYKDHMIQENLPKDYNKIDIKLWSGYYKALFTVSSNKQAFLVKLGIIPRKAVFRITGNLKARTSKLLGDTWEAMAGQVYDHDAEVKFGIGTVSPVQLRLVRENVGLIKELLLFSFHRHIDAVKVSCKLMWSCGVTMWLDSGSVRLFLEKCIPGLYDDYQSGRLYITDSDLQRYKLSTLYTIHPAPPAFAHMLSAIEDIYAFLHSVCNAFKISDQEEFDDDRTAVHMEMFTHLLEVNRPELFHQMSYNLFLHFLRRRDHVQAALCLELLANTYDWRTNDFLPALKFPPLPEQSSFERKEYLSKEAARYFSKGLKLEKALSIYKDLIAAYDLINYDFSGLAYAYREMSNIYSQLQTVDRLIPTYFKVSFSGLGFPVSIRNKTFIFEGLPFEHITSMHDRLLKLYHGTTVIRSQDEMDEHFVSPSMGRFIHVVGVDPQFDISEDYQKNADGNHLMTSKIWIYIKNRELQKFSNSVRLPGSTCVTDLWVNEITYTTQSTFPTLMNRSQVVDTIKRRLSPFQNAMRSLRVKIQEFNGLENMCWKVIKDRDSPTETFNELSRNLAGTIDSPVNGGFVQYREFFSPDLQPQLQREDAQSLEVAFSELAIVLARCLILHQELLPSKDLEQSHNMLVELFKKNFKAETKKNNINLDSLLATARMNASSSQHSSSPHLTRAHMLQNLLDSVSTAEKCTAGRAVSIHSKETSYSKNDTLAESNGVSTNINGHGLNRTDSATSNLKNYSFTTRPAPLKVAGRWALMGMDNMDNL